MSIFFYKVFYKFISFFYYFFLKKKKPVRLDNIAVLAKGESLRSFENYYYFRKKELDLLILTNFKNNDLLSFSLRDKIINIPITILGNITEPVISLLSSFNLKIYEVYVQRFYTKKESYGIRSKRKNFRLNSYGMKVKYLNKYIEKFYDKKGQETYKLWFIWCTSSLQLQTKEYFYIWNRFL